MLNKYWCAGIAVVCGIGQSAATDLSRPKPAAGYTWTGWYVGGLGLLIGDGQINYGTERIIETFYALSLMPQTTLTFDYQFIDNPAYNRDRGPVSIFAARLHAEF